MISDQAKSALVSFIVENDLREALVFVDDGMAEALRYLGGLSYLIQDFEISIVLDISDFLPEKNPERRVHRQCESALFLLSGYLWDTEATVARAAHLCGAKRVFVGCTTCEAAHGTHPLAEQLGDMDFRRMENQLSASLTRMFALNLASLSKTNSNNGNAEDSPPSSAQVIIKYLPLHMGVIFEGDLSKLENCIPLNSSSYVPSQLPPIFALSQPECARAFPLQCSNIKDASKEYTDVQQIEVAVIPDGIRRRFKLLAWSLAGLLSRQLEIDVADSIFALGKTSHLLAHNVLDCLSSLKDQDQPKASLILIDRTLDLAAPLSRQGGMVQRILANLPRAGSECSGPYASDKAHLHEVAVTLPKQTIPIMEPAPPSHSSTVLNALPAVSAFHAQLPPALFPGGEVSAALVHCLACLAETEGHSILRDILLKVIEDCGGPLPPNKKRGMGSEVMVLASSIAKANAVFQNSPLIQVSLAVVESMQRTAAVSKSSWDEVQSIQKFQNQMVHEGPCDADLVLQLIECLKCHETEEQKAGALLTFGDILELALHAVCLNGSLEDGAGMMLSGSLVNAIVSIQPSRFHELAKLPWLPEAVLTSLEKVKTQEAQQNNMTPELEEELLGLRLEIEDLVEDILIKRLKQAANTRSSLKSPFLRDLLSEGLESETLLGRLTELLLNPEEPDIPDLAKVSGAFEQLGKVGRGLIRSIGLGSRFTAPDKLPRPTDQPTVVICVVGGICFKEIQEACLQLKAKQPTGTNFLFCGTTVANPSFICEQILCHENV